MLKSQSGRGHVDISQLGYREMSINQVFENEINDDDEGAKPSKKGSKKRMEKKLLDSESEDEAKES